MIESIRIRNIALINETVIDFAKGLNVISGETGTGKSIIVNSMNLLIGDRADRELIKSGCDFGEVEAVLFIDGDLYKEIAESAGLDVEDDNQLIISRKITADGRNTCRINGSAVSLGCLKSCMEKIADLHGQHAHQALLYPKNQISFVDSYASDSISGIKEEINRLRKEFREKTARLEELNRYDENDIAKQLDYLRFQEEEIRRADIKKGETEELEAELKIIENAEENAKCLSESYDLLYGSEDHTVLNDLSHAVDLISRIKDLSPAYNDIYESLNSSYYAIEDSAHSIMHESGNVRFDEQRITDIRDRLDIIYGIKRKYADSFDDISKLRDSLAEQIDSLENLSGSVAELKGEISVLADKLYLLHNELLAARREAAVSLEPAVIAELTDLGMNRCSFSIVFSDIPEKDRCDFSNAELTSCDFMISTNPGEPEKPLSKVASGGEISRIMLAFKNVFANVDDIAVLIFDEIDTGISGHMARVVAEKMYAISRNKQIICITHLPQIVSFGDANYVVEKESDADTTVSRVRRLNGNEKADEVARLSGGTGASAAGNAAEMIQEADMTKQRIDKLCRRN